jgi:hypothetical protein
MPQIELRSIEYIHEAISDGFEITSSKRLGYFHLWDHKIDANTKALIEDCETGKVYSLEIEKIRFLSDNEALQMQTEEIKKKNQKNII